MDIITITIGVIIIYLFFISMLFANRKYNGILNASKILDGYIKEIGNSIQSENIQLINNTISGRNLLFLYNKSRDSKISISRLRFIFEICSITFTICLILIWMIYEISVIDRGSLDILIKTTLLGFVYCLFTWCVFLMIHDKNKNRTMSLATSAGISLAVSGVMAFLSIQIVIVWVLVTVGLVSFLLSLGNNN